MLHIFETYIAQLLFVFVSITGLMFIFQPAYIAWKDKNRDHNDTTTKSSPNINTKQEKPKTKIRSKVTKMLNTLSPR